MRKLPGAVLLLLSALIAACETGLDQRYLDASLGERLELPPDLQDNETRARFELPSTFSSDEQDERGGIPVLARVDSLKLQGAGDIYWLELNEPVDDLYRHLKNFWASEGYRLTIDEPIIGLMQTEWVMREQGSNEKTGNWFENLFGNDNLSMSQDQFRTRIERGEAGVNRIYMVHRGTEYQHVLKRDEKAPKSELKKENNWRFRQPDHELEVEMLARMMVYLGLQQAEADRQVEAARLFSPRAFMHVDTKENAPFLLLKDAYPIAWNRVYHNLERMNFNIDQADYKSGLSNEGIIIVSAETTGKDEGSLFSIFSSQKNERKQLVLVLSEANHEFTRVDIETPKGEIDTSSEGAEFMRLLYQQVK